MGTFNEKYFELPKILSGSYPELRLLKEFREEACRLVFEQGISLRQGSKNLGISDGILGRWIREVKSPEKTTRKALIPSDNERIQFLTDD